MDTRTGPAALAFAIGGVIHALNAYISFQERGFVEPLDVPLALALLGAAAFAWRGSRPALLVGAAASVVALALVAPSGAIGLIAFWVVALVVTVRAIRAG